MPETTSLPLLNRTDLDNKFDTYQAPLPTADLPNIPHEGLTTGSVGGEPTPSALSALENGILSIRGNDRLTGGSIPRSLAEVTSPRYNNYMPGNYNNEDAYGQGQSWGSKMVNGVGKGLLLTGTTFLQSTAGLVNGVVQAIGDGRAASFYDNDFNKRIDEINKKAEDALPNYYKDVEKNAAWYSPSKLLTANFFWDGIIKNMGFSAGAALSGMAYASALRALPLTAKLFSMGKAAETLAATEEGILAADKAASTYGKVKSLSDKFLGSYKAMNTGGQVLIAGLATTGEAGFEAYNNLNQFRNERIQEYKTAHSGQEPVGADIQAINDQADNVGNSSFLLNVGLLSATNYIQFPKILGSSYTAEKGMINSLKHEIGSVVTNEAGDYVEKAATGKFGKLLSNVNKVRPYLFSASEGFEEGAQYAIQVGTQDYYNKKYNHKATDFLSSMVEGIKQTVGTNEGMENVLIGGLSGSLMQIRGKFAEHKEIRQNTAAAIADFNKFKLSDFVKDTADSVNRGTAIQEEREASLRRGDVLESKDKEADYIINYLTPRIKYGRYDLVTSDIADYKQRAITDEGFAQLQSEGKALSTDTKEQYLQRLNNLEATANSIKSLHQSLSLRYGGAVDKEGKVVYNQEVMDKMIYAATKVADYDKRSPQLAEKLIGTNIDVDTIINDLSSGDAISYNDAMTTLDNSKSINKDEHIQALQDISEIRLRREQFLKEYSDIKNNPADYTTIETPVAEAAPGEKKQTVAITTKDGDENLETGIEYYAGAKQIEVEEGGVINKYSKFKLLGESEDGKSLKIQTPDGKIQLISKAAFEQYKIGKVVDTDKRPNAKFFIENTDNIFKFNLGKGNVKEGKLSYDPKTDALTFTSLDGKFKKQVTRDQFSPKQGYDVAQIWTTKKFTPKAEEALKEEVSAAEKLATRNKIILDLYNDSKKRLDEVNTTLEKNKTKLSNIAEALDNLSKTKEGLPRKQFTKAIKKTINDLNSSKEDIQKEITKLEAEKEELEITLPYFQDLSENIGELDETGKEMLKQFKDDIANLEELIEHTNDAISSGNGLIKSIDSALQNAFSLLNDFIKRLKEENPKVPLSLDDLQEQLARFQGEEGAKQFIEDRLGFTELVLDLESQINDFSKELSIPELTTKTEKLKNQIVELQSGLDELIGEQMAKAKILEAYENFANEFKKQKEEEAALLKNEKLKQKFLGTNGTDVQTNIDDKGFEPESKKPTLAVVLSTMPINDGKAHQERANNFGFRLPSLSNRNKIKSVIVTSKTEDQILPGLTAHLANNKVEPSTIIVMVAVQENEDGTFVLVDEFGKPLKEDAVKIDSAIYQVYPGETLQAIYNQDSKEKETMFRDTVSDVDKKILTEQYNDWRKNTLNQSTLGKLEGIEASFGLPEFNKTPEGKIDHAARTSATEAGLITESMLDQEPVLTFATTNDSVTNGSVTFKTPLGRVFLTVPGGLVKLFSRKFNVNEATNIFNVINQIAKNAAEDGDYTDRSKTLMDWLKSTVYWGIAKNTQTGALKPGGYNNIWFEDVVEDGKTYTKLFISGKGEGFAFTPASLSANKDVIISLLQNMYFNANATLSNQKSYDKPYFEIISLDKDGKPKYKRWNNYQSYLLSSEGRKSDEVPFTTKFAPIKNGINRKAIYFTRTDTADNFVIPSKPTVNAAPVKQGTIAPIAPVSSATTPSAPDAVIPNYKLDGSENTIQLGTFGSTTFKLDGKKFNETNGNEGFSPTFDGALVTALMAAKGFDREKAQQVIAASILAKVKDQLELLKAPPVANIEEGASEEEITTQDDWNSHPVNAPDDKAYRLKLIEEINNFEGENWSKFEKFLKEKFPNLPVFRVKNMIQATNGRQAWGMLHKAAIYLTESAEIGSGYHEVFEAVWKMFTDPNERKSILKEFKTRKGEFLDRESQQKIKFSEATPQQIKEQLAEEFRDYMLYNKIPAKPTVGRPFIVKMFSDLVNFFKTLFTGESAQINTANLFTKIGEGYYKDYIPSENILSYANAGIIDIEDAIGDESSDFRIDIPYTQTHEIMQQMTYSTLAELTNTNQSLFNIPSLDKTKLYNRLKTEVKDIVRFKGSLIEKAFADKSITQEQYKRQISKLQELYGKIESEWNNIVAKHAEYLKIFSIEFDENDATALTEDKTKDNPYGDARQMDNFRKANAAIKFLIGTLPVVYSEGNEEKVKRSSIGGAMLVPSDKVFITLMNSLHASTNIDDMLNRLRQLAEKDPNYRTLYKRITKRSYNTPGVDFSQLENVHDIQLLSSFWRTFKRQSADVRTVFILPSGDVVIGDSTLASAAKQSRSEMASDIISILKNKNPYISYNSKSKLYNTEAAINNIKLDPKKIESYISFLNKLGIDFSERDIQKLKGNHPAVFFKAVEGILKSLQEVKDLGSLTTKTLNIDNRLLELGSIKAIITNPEFESTYFNINGERTQTFIGTNAMSDLYDVLSKLDNINGLTGTKYEYLLTDPFVKGNASYLMSRMFNLETGDRKANTVDILKTAYADGTINEQNGKKKESSKLTYKERIIQEMNLNSDGYYLNLVPGDASIEWMVKMHNSENPFVSAEALSKTGFDEAHRIFQNYFMAELDLARENRPIVQDSSKSRKSTDLRFYKSILGSKTHEAIVNDLDKTNEEIYKKYKSRIESALENFIKKEADSTENVLRQYGVITNTEEGMKLEGVSFTDENIISEAALRDNLQALSINYMIANIELHKMMYSDPYQYKDELKRIKNFNSPRTSIVANSAKINSAINKIYNKGIDSEDLAWTDFTKDFFKTITIADVFSISDLEGYDAFEETDGGGIISMKANRNFRIRAGNWNDAEERQFQYDIVYEKRAKSIKLNNAELVIWDNGNPEVKSAYTPIKPIVSGNKGNGKTYNDVMLDKFALVPLSYRIVHQLSEKDAKGKVIENNAVKLYNKMQAEDIDYGVYATGRKVGAEEVSPLYNENGSFNTESFKGIINVPFSIMSVQSEVPSKDTPQVTQGSQITKLATLDFMEAGVPIDFKPGESFDNRFTEWVSLSDDDKMKSEIYKEIINNQKLLEAKIEYGVKSLYKKLGIKLTETVDDNGKTLKSFELENVDKMIKTLSDEILKREVNDNILDAFKGFKDGHVVLEATPAYQQIRNILYSIADGSVISQKISGGMKVQIPSTLLETNRVKSEIVNGKNALTSDILKFYEDKDGKRVCEVMVGRWFKSDKTDEEILNDWYTTDTNGNKILTENGRDALSGIGFRIPTQKQNSIDSFIIAKFLPKEFGDSVVIPSALVKKVGSDFDIDKLSMYLKNIYQGAGNKYHAVPYFGIGKEAIEAIKKWYSPEKVTDLTEEEKEEDENNIDRLYRQSLENEYINSLQRLVSHPLNFSQLVKPNSADQLKDLAKDINKKLGRPEIDYSSTGNMLSRIFMSTLRQAFVRGKYAIGIAATSQTNHAQNQRGVIYINDDMLDRLDYKDYKWLGDAQIMFNQYNSININGKDRPTLSKVKSANGIDYISDIIGQFIDGYVDISKGPWIMELGATPNVAGTWLFLAKIGVPIKSIAYFMNQPIIIDYLRSVESAGYSYLFINPLVNSTLDDYYNDVNLEEGTKIPNDNDLEKMIGKSDLNEKQKAEQQLILKEFLKYAKMAEQLLVVTQGSNFDTATINDPYLVFKKQQQLEKARKTVISSVDDLLNNSFIGFLKNNIYDFRDALSTILTSDKQKVRSVLEKVLKPFVEVNDKDFVKISRKAVNDLFDWAVQTNTRLNNSVANILLGDSTSNSAANDIIAFQQQVLGTKENPNKNHPLFDNIIINSIKKKPGAREGSPDNLYLVGRDNKVYDQNQLIYGFRDLKNNVTKDLYGKLVRLAVIQSGLNNSPIAFTSLLPYEDFKDIYNDTLSKLETMPIEDLNKFHELNVFQRNNWSNEDVVIPMRAFGGRSKKGNWYYNLNMKFKGIPKIAKAIAEGNIPQMLKISPLTREGNSEFISYSWEDESLSSSTKKEMRKKGNYSYIKKGLFKKVYDSNGVPVVVTETSKDGKIYENYLYKVINAWGDSFRANEFYQSGTASKLDNGFIKVEKGVEIKRIGDTNSTYEIKNSGEVDDVTIENAIEYGIVPTDESISIDKSKKINIYSSKGDNPILSNFARRVFNYEGIQYQSVEHAYQTLKSGKFDGPTYARANDFINTKKNAPKNVNKDISLDLMKNLIKTSFEQNKDALRDLLDTGNLQLTHLGGSDKFWEENFPKLLMEVRSELANAKTLESLGFNPIEIGKILKSIC